VSISLVARRYASALVEIGQETGLLDSIADEIDNAAAAYLSSADLRNAIDNPLIALEAKKTVAVELAARLGVGEISKNTLLLLIDRRRMRALPQIARYLREMTDARKGLLRAEVTTAAPLSDAYYEKLKAQLEKMTGKRVVVDRKQDPTLIAGVVTRIGDRIFDGSLKTRLETMRDALMPQA
jgi:F-type H+-transporting ATPase subunit delta